MDSLGRLVSGQHLQTLVFQGTLHWPGGILEALCKGSILVLTGSRQERALFP